MSQIATIVNSGYYIFPPLPEPDIETPKAWVSDRGDYYVMTVHMLSMLYYNLGRKVEELNANGKTILGYGEVEWQPTEVYKVRTPMLCEETKRKSGSCIPNDGIGDELVSTFYGWTLGISVLCQSQS